MNEYSKKFLRTHLVEIIMSIPKTIYFNFKVLPVRQAIKLPYVVSFRVKLSGINRKNFLTNAKKLSTGSMRIGFGDSITSRRESPKSLLCVKCGGMIQVGKNLGLSQGCVICVNNAKLVIGNKFRCNYSTTIDCSDTDIEIGNNVVFGWNVTIKNSDGHYVLENGKDSIISKKIVIKDHVWICAYSTLLKGTCIQNNSVVAYGALVTNTIDREGVLYGGVPAKIIKENINWKE